MWRDAINCIEIKGLACCVGSVGAVGIASPVASIPACIGRLGWAVGHAAPVKVVLEEQSA